ncbi:hypothetical protein TNCV_4261961 [Trichonephila clavipes]|nr:hypothetical protein TNCV_4261961 [Trichonephila clavipes]
MHNTFSATIDGKCNHCYASRRTAFPHSPTRGENKHRPALPATTWDWLLKHHPTAHASAGLDSCVDIMYCDRKHPAVNVLRTSVNGRSQVYQFEKAAFHFTSFSCITYLCKSSFPMMNIIKTAYHSHSKDDHLESNARFAVINYIPRYS